MVIAKYKIMWCKVSNQVGEEVRMKSEPTQKEVGQKEWSKMVCGIRVLESFVGLSQR